MRGRLLAAQPRAQRCTACVVSGPHGRRNDSHPLFQVCLNLHNEVERLESALQLVAVYVGPFAVAQLALGFKLHVVYDEAMSARAGVHFIALTHTHRRRKQRKIFDKDNLLLQHLFFLLVVNSLIHKWCSPEYYPVEFCLEALVSCSPFQVLWHKHQLC